MSIGQNNAMEVFAAKWNDVSEISKVLLNDTFAELDGSSEIKNIVSYSGTTDYVLEDCK